MRLTPRDTSFYDLFNQAADNNVAGTTLLSKLAHSTDGRAELAKEIRQLEHAGDTITHAVLRKLASTFVTPFDREDIYRLASSLDDVMDFVEAAADLVILYKLGELPQEMLAAVDVLVEAAAVAADGMPKLRGLKGVREPFIEVNRLENEADKLYRKTVARLFSGEYEPLEVLKLKEVAEQIEMAVDALENLADAVETIVIKEK